MPLESAVLHRTQLQVLLQDERGLGQLGQVDYTAGSPPGPQREAGAVSERESKAGLPRAAGLVAIEVKRAVVVARLCGMRGTFSMSAFFFTSLAVGSSLRSSRVPARLNLWSNLT